MLPYFNSIQSLGEKHISEQFLHTKEAKLILGTHSFSFNKTSSI